MEVDDQGTAGKRGPTATEVGGRLQVSLKRRGWTVQALLLRLVDNDVTIGQTAIYKYVKGVGDSVPPVEFLQPAAEILGVRFAWLAGNQGAMTDFDEEARLELELDARAKLSGTAIGGRRWSDELSETLEEATGVHVPAMGHAVVAHHWRKLYALASNSETTTVGGDDMLRRLVQAITAPLKTLGVELKHEDLANYIIAVTPAIAHAESLRIVREQISVQDVKEAPDA
ncbi:MAG: hypothetical protein IH968_09980 [Gemmatimonadetes bacterium]|nr:hypothetical protein [Gemmatimonadota bacterium]